MVGCYVAHLCYSGKVHFTLAYTLVLISAFILNIEPATLAAIIALIMGGLFSMGTLGMAYFTLKSNTARDAVLLTQNAQALLQKANLDTVQMLERRVQLLEEENKDLRIKIDQCHDDKQQLLETNNELMQRVLGIHDAITSNKLPKPRVRREIREDENR